MKDINCTGLYEKTQAKSYDATSNSHRPSGMMQHKILILKSQIHPTIFKAIPKILIGILIIINCVICNDL